MMPGDDGKGPGLQPEGMFPFHHLHPKFRDHEGLEQLCEPGGVQLRGVGDTNAVMRGHCGAFVLEGVTGERAVGPPGQKVYVPTGPRWHAVLLPIPAEMLSTPHPPGMFFGAVAFRLLLKAPLA